MTILSIGAVVDLAYRAGFRGSDLVVAVAVAKAESGFDTRAHNTNARTGDNSYSLWQINMLGHLAAPRLVRFGIKSNDELFTPSVNAHAAFCLYSDRGKRFGDWSTYNHGSHKPFLDDAQTAVDAYTKPHPTPAPKPAPHPAPAPAFTLGRLLVNTGDRKTLMHGGDVKAFQARLIHLGFHLPKWGADGVYGDESEVATRAFQHHARILEDGKAGHDTTVAAGGHWTGK